jgi:hypothetical protein
VLPDLLAPGLRLVVCGSAAGVRSAQLGQYYAGRGNKLWRTLAEGDNTVLVALGRKTVDRYAFSVQHGLCALPDTSGNTFSADGSLEYAACGKSYATIAPGCAWDGATGMAQP